MENEGEIILYHLNEQVKLEVRLENETIWLTQAQIAELFGTQRQAITKHLKNIFQNEELIEDSVCSILELTAADGKNYKTKVYNLDAILSIGYRVNSKNATLFRQWANRILKEYLLKGYAVNLHLERLEKQVFHKFEAYDQMLSEHKEKLDFFIRTSLPPVEGIFFEGQIFDAYAFANQLIRTAKKSLILIDNYVDESVLLMFSKRNKGVIATIYTRQITPQLQLDLERHNDQYPPINIKTCKQSHDRFLIIDEMEVYHIGASLKDLGRKWFAFSRLHIDIKDILRKL
ncbi:virulence RhuM family protein [Phocaeicola sp.]